MKIVMTALIDKLPAIIRNGVAPLAIEKGKAVAIFDPILACPQMPYYPKRYSGSRVRKLGVPRLIGACPEPTRACRALLAILTG
jgi:hypothetical protein